MRKIVETKSNTSTIMHAPLPEYNKLCREGLHIIVLVHDNIIRAGASGQFSQVLT